MSTVAEVQELPSPGLRRGRDEALVERLRAGSTGAFEAIFARYHPEILWFCRRKLRSREDAEDAAQNTFITAYRELLSGEREIDLRPWLYGIARHRCLTVLRDRREHADVTDHEFLPAAEDAALAVARRQDLRELLADMGALPDRQRNALLMSEVGGLPHAKVAAALECRPNQVKALVFQARTNLHDSRRARGADCREIREQLASARGASLLRGHLRRHVKDCPGCQAFAAARRRDRSPVALGLSMFPALGSFVTRFSTGIRASSLLAGLAERAPLTSGGWRWAGALTLTAATTAGGLVAAEQALPGGRSPASHHRTALIASAGSRPADGGAGAARPGTATAPASPWPSALWTVPAGRTGTGGQGVRERFTGGTLTSFFIATHSASRPGAPSTSPAGTTPALTPAGTTPALTPAVSTPGHGSGPRKSGSSSGQGNGASGPGTSGRSGGAGQPGQSGAGGSGGRGGNPGHHGGNGGQSGTSSGSGSQPGHGGGHGGSQSGQGGSASQSGNGHHGGSSGAAGNQGAGGQSGQGGGASGRHGTGLRPRGAPAARPAITATEPARPGGEKNFLPFQPLLAGRTT